MAPKRQQQKPHKETTNLIQQGPPIPDLEKKMAEAELQVQFQQIKHTRQYSGPIPPAVEMAELNKVVPGAAERVLAMAERAQQHEQAMQLMQERRANAGIIWAGCITGACLLLAGFALWLGQVAAAIAIVSVGMAAVVGPFIWGTTLNYKERLETMRRYNETLKNESEQTDQPKEQTPKLPGID